MVRGGCKHCGQRTTNNRLCNRCQRLEQRDLFTDATTNTVPITDDTLEDHCTSCGHKYTATSSELSPKYNPRYRRYIGSLPNKHSDGPELVADGGTNTTAASEYVIPTGMATLGPTPSVPNVRS